MRRPLLPTLALAGLLLPVTALAQSNAERIANDWYTRSHDFDLVHQRIEVRAIDWDSTSFDGSVATTLVSLRTGADSVVLDAGAGLDIERVTAPRGVPLRADHRGDTLVVRLPGGVAFGDTVRFTIGYHARIRSGHGLTFIEPEGRTHRHRQLWSQGEDNNNHDWFPTYDFPNDKMTWEVIATVPTRYTVVSNGRLVSDRRAGRGQHRVHWSQRSPASSYLVSLIVGTFHKVHDTWRGIPVDYYVYPEDSALARPLFRYTPRTIAVYSELTGVTYPWAKYAQTTVADFFGGMENVSATTLVDWLPDARSYADRPWYQYILIPHELAHQWFGDYVTTENWANMWLNEGFAEFMPGAFWEHEKGMHASDDYYMSEYQQFMSIDARRSMPLASLGSNNIYPKGALVLRMLRRYLGDDRFWASVHEYLVRHAHGGATSDDFRQAVLAATGENLAWFWDEWVYQAGYPSYTVEAKYDSASRALTLAVTQTQTDTATADSSGLRYGTPPAFRMPVTVRVGTPAGDVTRTVLLKERKQTIELDTLPAAPNMVVFDDGNRVLKRLTFDQPTAWLATQLRRDGDLWNRWWVIGQLADRREDTTAARALADAATDADYYLTRAQAAGALGRFAPELALPALARAAADTSSAVRQAALVSLGEIGGDRALAIARAAWANDTSYQVRAAAVGALARMDSAGRHAFLVSALDVPSYRDVVQNATLAAIARYGDTAFVGTLETKLGTQLRVAVTLGALASRGSDSALAVLASHLNDDRAYVRQWVVLTFQRVVTPTVAAKRLQAVLPSLKYAETKTAVERLMSGED
ncbi:MAG TPA: M1 family aminopeptidase [Gemmatimonadaceae bacterium]